MVVRFRLNGIRLETGIEHEKMGFRWGFSRGLDGFNWVLDGFRWV